MGQHRPARVVKARRHVRLVARLRAFHRTAFKGDGWWLVGFLLGFCTGALLLWAGFLWWLTGEMTSFIRGLF